MQKNKTRRVRWVKRFIRISSGQSANKYSKLPYYSLFKAKGFRIRLISFFLPSCMPNIIKKKNKQNANNTVPCVNFLYLYFSNKSSQLYDTPCTHNIMWLNLDFILWKHPFRELIAQFMNENITVGGVESHGFHIININITANLFPDTSRTKVSWISGAGKGNVIKVSFRIC